GDLGLDAHAVARRFMYQQSGAQPFHRAARDWRQRARHAAPPAPGAESGAAPGPQPDGSTDSHD
ncbi:MAG: hypothetical protein K9L70_08105, partial [Thiohalocapsa sp.]|nr:hypothetical protein [Thiohalocapsa sp.]